MREEKERGERSIMRGRTLLKAIFRWTTFRSRSIDVICIMWEDITVLYDQVLIIIINLLSVHGGKSTEGTFVMLGRFG